MELSWVDRRWANGPPRWAYMAYIYVIPTKRLVLTHTMVRSPSICSWGPFGTTRSVRQSAPEMVATGRRPDRASPNRRDLSFHGSKYDAHWQGARCIRRSTRGWRASFSFWECCSCSCGSACASSSYRPSSRDRFVTSTHVLIPLQPRLPPDTSSSACGSCI